MTYGVSGGRWNCTRSLIRCSQRKLLDFGVPGDGGSSNTFLVEHLASFDATVATAEGASGASSALMSTDEAMRRLRQLTMRRSIWTSRVTIVVTGAEMLVLDTQTSAVMEKFPLSLIHRPTAVKSDVVGDNIVCVVVLGDPAQQLPPEVHIFKCLKHPASILFIDSPVWLRGTLCHIVSLWSSALSSDSFRKLLKTELSASYSAH